MSEKLSAKRRIYVVVFPYDGPAQPDNKLPKTLDDVKQKVAEKYGFDSFEELEKLMRFI